MTNIHETAICRRVGPQHYHGKSWSDRFTCPVCGKTQRRNLNFLGNRKELVCDGRKMTPTRIAVGDGTPA